MNRTILLGLADAPAGTGRLIEAALTAAGQSWTWFLGWITEPGNLQKLLTLAADVAGKNWTQAVQDAAALFKGDQP